MGYRLRETPRRSAAALCMMSSKPALSAVPPACGAYLQTVLPHSRADFGACTVFAPQSPAFPPPETMLPSRRRAYFGPLASSKNRIPATIPHVSASSTVHILGCVGFGLRGALSLFGVSAGRSLMIGVIKSVSTGSGDSCSSDSSKRSSGSRSCHVATRTTTRALLVVDRMNRCKQHQGS